MINLKEGEILINKDLVELFGTHIQKVSFEKKSKLEGKTKKRLLGELGRYCNFTEKRRSQTIYVINEVFDKPLDKSLDKRVNNGRVSIFRDNAYYMMMYTLREQAIYANPIYLTTREMLGKTCLVSNNFLVASKQGYATATAIYFNTEERYVNSFINDVRSRGQYIVESTLEQLRKDNMLMWSKEFYIYEYEQELTQHFKKPKVYGKVKSKGRIATDKEKEFIMGVRSEVAKEMGYTDKSLNVLIQDGKYNIFNKRVLDKLREENIHSYYYTYKIILNRKGVKYELDEFEKSTQAEHLNAKFVDKSKELTESRFKKNQINFGDGLEANKSRTSSIRGQQEFREISMVLIDLLIDKDADGTIGEGIIATKLDLDKELVEGIKLLENIGDEGVWE